jgi:hypothetical protein
MSQLADNVVDFIRGRTEDVRLAFEFAEQLIVSARRHFARGLGDLETNGSFVSRLAPGLEKARSGSARRPGFGVLEMTKRWGSRL